MNRRRELVRLLRIVGAAGLSVAVLLRAGSVLPAPPRRLDELEAWVVAGGTARAVFTLLRLVGIGLAGYVGLVFAVAVAGVALRIPTLLLVSDRLSGGAVRRLASVSTTVVALSASALAAPAGARTVDGPGDGAVVMRLVPAPETSDQRPGAATTTADAPVMRLVDRAVDRAVPPPEAILPGATMADVLAAGRDHDVANVSLPTVRVEPGDHLWGIAERIVTTAESEPSERAVRSYWAQLVAANRDRLADPANPDLLFAGQELVLPPIDQR